MTIETLHAADLAQQRETSPLSELRAQVWLSSRAEIETILADPMIDEVTRGIAWQRLTAMNAFRDAVKRSG
jgi:hypothetical protein